MKDIGVVIVNYNSGGLLERCISSVLASKLCDKNRIVVIDCGSTDSSEEKAIALGIKVLRVGNIGYGAACNLGAKYLATEYLLFLNPDTEILEVDLETLAEFMEQGNALIAPLIVEQGKEIQSVYPFFGPIYDALVRDTGLNRFSLWLHRDIPHNGPYRFAGWASGAAILVNKAAFLSIGGFDEGFFLYYEDVDLYHRFITKFGKQIYLPSFVIAHVGGGSSSNLNWSRTAIRYDSKLYYWQKHSGSMALLVHKVITISILLLKLAYAHLSRHKSKIPAYFFALKVYLSSTDRFKKIRRSMWWWKIADQSRKLVADI